MQRRRARLTALLALTLAGILLPPAATSAAPDAATCQGRPVTVPGNTGTDGDDVMVVVTAASGTASTGAGADLVCIREGHRGEPYTFNVDTGAGNDTVHNEIAGGGMRATVVLGTGADTYTGSDAYGETVVAGPSAWTRLGDAADTEDDTIRTGGGSDVVHSGSTTPGSRNRDTVDTGDGDDVLHWAGEGTGAPVVLGPGANSLSLYPGWQGAAEIDAAAGRATLDGRPALQWTGTVRAWRLLLDTASTTFSGTDADENLTVESTGVAGPQPGLQRTISMNGGDDVVDLWTSASGRLDGGAGVDRISARCATAQVRLGGTYRCTEVGIPRVEHSGTITGLEDVTVVSYSTAEVIGTNGADAIRATGSHVRIDGRDGDDRLQVEYFDDSTGDRATSTVRGGRGSDLVAGSSGHDRLLGGAGRDRLLGLHGNDTLLGGGGRDRMEGGLMADRLFGGAARDVARGDGGRDRCRAEVTRSCELPAR